MCFKYVGIIFFILKYYTKTSPLTIQNAWRNNWAFTWPQQKLELPCISPWKILFKSTLTVNCYLKLRYPWDGTWMRSGFWWMRMKSFFSFAPGCCYLECSTFLLKAQLIVIVSQQERAPSTKKWDRFLVLSPKAFTSLFQLKLVCEN